MELPIALGADGNVNDISMSAISGAERTLRFFGLPLVRTIYRVKAIGLEHLPRGGFLLLANLHHLGGRAHPPHRLSDNQLQLVDGHLHVVALDEAVRAHHDPHSGSVKLYGSLSKNARMARTHTV